MNSRIQKIAELDSVKNCLKQIECNESEDFAFQKELALIEAPTFSEGHRAQKIKTAFEQIGLCNVCIDEIGNVFGTSPGSSTSSVVIEAHMDTVFPMGSAQTVREENGVYYCPGISDNTRGVAALYGLAKVLRNSTIMTEKNIVFVATVREEGLGSCSGLEFYLDNHPETECCFSVDGPDSDIIILGGPGTRTIEIEFQGKGDHAYVGCGHVGNPIRTAVRAMCKLSSIKPLESPKTTCEITSFHAGNMSGIHAIPASAVITMNFRSESPAHLEQLESTIMRAIEEGVSEENAFIADPHSQIHFEVRDLVRIPVALAEKDSKIVQIMADAISFLGMKPVYDEKCPTNANITIAKNIPGICIGGGGKGGCYHSPGEWYDPSNSYLALQAAFLALMESAKIRI